MKKLLLTILTRRNLKKRIPIEPHSFQSARNIGIAVNMKGLNESHFNDFVRAIRSEGKKVKILQIDTYSKKLSEKVIGKEDISLFGKIKSNELSKFLSKKYDFMLVVDQHSDYHIEYLMGLCQAAYRIGFNRDPDSRILDLQIKPEKNRELDDLLKYTKMIHHA